MIDVEHELEIVRKINSSKEELGRLKRQMEEDVRSGRTASTERATRLGQTIRDLQDELTISPSDYLGIRLDPHLGPVVCFKSEYESLFNLQLRHSKAGLPDKFDNFYFLSPMGKVTVLKPNTLFTTSVELLEWFSFAFEVDFRVMAQDQQRQLQDLQETFESLE